MVLFLEKYFFYGEKLVFQSDTVPTKFRTLVAISLNHKASFEVNSQYVYIRAITVVARIFVFDTKKPQSGRTDGAAIPVGAI